MKIPSYESILSDNGVEVVKENDQWGLVWTHGVIIIGPVEDEVTAREAAAIFVISYLHKLDVAFCVARARDYAYIVTLESLLDKANKTLADYGV